MSARKQDIESGCPLRNHASIIESLPARLHEAGYQTAYFGSNPFAGARRQGYSAYFDHEDSDIDWMYGPCFDTLTLRLPYLCPAAENPLIKVSYLAVVRAANNVGLLSLSPHSDLERIVARVGRWTEGHDRAPVFLWVHLFPPHEPYAAPEPWLGQFDHSLADRNHAAYVVVDPNDPNNVLTVRDSVEGPRRIIPREQWGFARDETGKRIADTTHVYMATKFEPNKIYEVVYTAENPPLVGLGPAAIRDVVSMLKYKSADALSIPAGAITRATAFGVSQSGRFLRKYLYDGFNRSEDNRKVFDGVIAHVAGAGRGSFNHRFAQPSRDGHPYLNFFYPTDVFPFTDVAQKDPETGVTDGLLTHPGSPELLPKIFYTNSEYEYWGRAASLVHTTVDGTGDAPLMDNVRIYLLSAGQHGPAGFPPPQTIGQQKNNPLDYRWAMKALLVAMDRWTATGTTPPPSRYPRIADGTLVSPEKLRFPKLAGVTTTTTTLRAYRVDYGPRFATEGVITFEPPKIGRAFPMLVPQVDADGNGIAGIRMPELAVPLATYTGWNLFNDRSGPTTVLSSMQGSYIPLARTGAERKQKNDPRAAIDERYRDKDQYIGQVSKAAQGLIDQGYLLQEDLAVVVKNAARHWDYIASTASPSTAQR